jgi:hypothetical protein
MAKHILNTIEHGFHNKSHICVGKGTTIMGLNSHQETSQLVYHEMMRLEGGNQHPQMRWILENLRQDDQGGQQWKRQG